MPDGAPALARGTLVEVRGPVADPYGQTELRPASTGIRVLGTAGLPASVGLTAGQAGEATEGRLATIRGHDHGRAREGDERRHRLHDRGDRRRVAAHRTPTPAPGSDAGVLRKGASATFTGIVGQRASRKGALDGYRLWVRDRADIAGLTQPGSSPTPSQTPRPSATPGPNGVRSIAAAQARDGENVTVEGLLTVERTLLDASGRRTIVEDSTGAIEAYLPEPDGRLRLGTRVRLTGVVGKAWGAPRLKVADVRVLGTGTPAARALKGSPTAATEWRLVRVTGTIADVHRSGDRWTAELATSGSTRLLLGGLAGSGIAGTSVIEGRSATITGIVKRAVPDGHGPAVRHRPAAADGPRARTGRGGSRRHLVARPPPAARRQPRRRRRCGRGGSGSDDDWRPGRRPPRSRGAARTAGPHRRPRDRGRG